MGGTGRKRLVTIISTDEMMEELRKFDPIIFKYYYGMSTDKVKNLFKTDLAEAKRYGELAEYEKAHQFSCMTKRNYADDYANLNLVYGEKENTLHNINLMELVLNKWISQYINIDGMERLFSETYIEFEWEMHLSADYKKHNMKFYRDHFFHQVKDTYMMYIMLKDHGFYEYIKAILENDSESKVSRFVSRSLAQQQYQESALVHRLRQDDQDFYIRNMIYMASFMAGLFHDIGYPETYYMTTSRRIRDYIASIHELNSNGSDINKIYSLLQNSLLFRVEPLENIESRISNAKKTDHGALSAIIFLLHFYENGAIYTLQPYKKAAIELAALAIYNHTNKYGIQGEKKYDIYRPCFSLNPISYLLRICDDLQEWDRIYFVISEKSNIVFCNDCKTPIIGYKEKEGEEFVSRYRCNCQFLSGIGDKDKNNRNADRHIQAFDGRSKFSYRRIYNVSVCDKVLLEDKDFERKMMIKLHYDPYKLLHVAYLDTTYAKFRISELNMLKKLFEAQKGIPQIYLDYFVTSNPIHIKVKILEEYLECKSTRSHLIEEESTWKKPFIHEIMKTEGNEFIVEGELDVNIQEVAKRIQECIKPVKQEFLAGIFRDHIKGETEPDVIQDYRNKMEKYIDMALELYSKLLIYQWLNEYINDTYLQDKNILLKSEWAFVQQYLATPELRCMIEDCFLQFTRMYLDVSDCKYYPKEYYEQYQNGEREEIFSDILKGSGEHDTTASRKYFRESEEYYYKALVRYLDPELFYPISMIRKENESEINVITEKRIDAFTDLYLFFLMNREMNMRR